MNKTLSIVVILIAVAGWGLLARQNARLKQLTVDYENAVKFGATSFASAEFFQDRYYLLASDEADEAAEAEPVLIDGEPLPVRQPQYDQGMTELFVREYNRTMRSMVRKKQRYEARDSDQNETVNAEESESP